MTSSHFRASVSLPLEGGGATATIVTLSYAVFYLSRPMLAVLLCFVLLCNSKDCLCHLETLSQMLLARVCVCARCVCQVAACCGFCSNRKQRSCDVVLFFSLSSLCVSEL